MAKFGYETIGVLTLKYPDSIYGTKFTCPSSGQATAITIYIDVAQPSGGVDKLKLGIYRVSDNVLIGYTEEKEWATAQGVGWEEFAIVSGGVLVGGEDYYLCHWQDRGYIAVYQNNLVGDVGVANETYSYDGWPNPYVIQFAYDRTFSIFCTYTPTPPAVPPAAEINPDAFTGYHCFQEQFQKRRGQGKIPYKKPDGTLYRSAPSG